MPNVNDYKLENLTDSAEKAGIFISTVSRVINNNPYINPETQMKIELATKNQKYKPNKIATGQRSKNAFSNLLGVLIPDIQNPFYVESLIH